MSFIVSEAQGTDEWAGEGSSRAGFQVKKEEAAAEEDFTFDEPCLKKQKTSDTTLPASKAQSLRNDLNMNWDVTEVWPGY